MDVLIHIKQVKNILLKILRVAYYTVKIGIALFFISSCVYSAYKEYAYHPVNQKKPFDSNVWKMMDRQAKKSSDDLMLERCYMYLDLIDVNINLGISYRDVIALLGMPHSIEFYQSKRKSLKKPIYYIGNCKLPTENANHIYLSLYFDENSSLIDFEDNINFLARRNNKLKNPDILDNTKELASCNKKDLEGKIYKCYTSTHNAEGKLEDVLTALNVKAW